MTKSKVATINLEEEKLYVVRDSKLVAFDKPKSGYGKQEVTWNNGKVTHVTTESKVQL